MDSPAHPIEELGVTRLAQTCGHIFCRKELSVFLAPRLVPGSHSRPSARPCSASADGCMKEYVCPHNSIWLQLQWLTASISACALSASTRIAARAYAAHDLSDVPHTIHRRARGRRGSGGRTGVRDATGCCISGRLPGQRGYSRVRDLPTGPSSPTGWEQEPERPCGSTG